MGNTAITTTQLYETFRETLGRDKAEKTVGAIRNLVHSEMKLAIYTLATRDQLEKTNEKLEATNEKLEAANEQVGTINEQVGAINEQVGTINEQMGAISDRLDGIDRSEESRAGKGCVSTGRYGWSPQQ